jgi:hypothetical protein
MIDIAALAQQAVTVLGPSIALAASSTASHMADGFLSEPGAKLFDWLTSKLNGTPAASTLDRAVSEPKNPRRLEALRIEIEDLAAKDEQFRDQLAKLLEEMAAKTGGVSATQTSTQIGDINKNAQAAGKDIHIQIG